MHRPGAWGAGIVLLAFSVRVFWVLRVPSRPVGDFALYREAAAYLLEHGHLDPEFIYMPGWVFLLAGVQAAGGGLLAAKMLGVVAGTTVVFAVGGIGKGLFGSRVGLVSAALAAVWPAGIAVASVTGTDMPAAALLVLGILALVRFGLGRPWLAAVLCGLAMGLGAWIRAVAVPLVVVSALFWLALGIRWRIAVGRAAVSLAVAFLVLLPWGLRNQRVYGQCFFTDSHGGNTALVGANPNSEGTYSRSLNLMFTDGTGYRLFEPPARHRQSDRAAYTLAKQWAAFEPLYAVGLIVAKADRLLTHERNLLYWPVFRQGVLPEGQRRFFDAHRPALDRLTDGFWWALVALATGGVALASRRREWPALSLLAMPLALAGIYTLFFSEVRYHLAIAPLLFPYAGRAAVWLALSVRRPFRGESRDLVVGALAIAALFVGWTGLLAVGRSLRADHRWAVTVCAYPDATQMHLCNWRRILPPTGDSPLRGVWDGVGLEIGNAAVDDVVASAQTIIPIGAEMSETFRVRALVSVTGHAPHTAGGLAVALRVDGNVFARVAWPAGIGVSPSDEPAGEQRLDPRAGEVNVPIAGAIQHQGGPLVLEVDVEPGGGGAGAGAAGETVWISELVVERVPGSGL